MHPHLQPGRSDCVLELLSGFRLRQLRVAPHPSSHYSCRSSGVFTHAALHDTECYPEWRLGEADERPFGGENGSLWQWADLESDASLGAASIQPNCKPCTTGILHTHN